jgi:hypothetical protein
MFKLLEDDPVMWRELLEKDNRLVSKMRLEHALLLSLEAFSLNKSCVWISIKRVIFFSFCVGADKFVGSTNLIIHIHICTSIFLQNYLFLIQICSTCSTGLELLVVHIA